MDDSLYIIMIKSKWIVLNTLLIMSKVSITTSSITSSITTLFLVTLYGVSIAMSFVTQQNLPLSWMLNIPFIQGISEDIKKFVQSTCNKYQKMFLVYCPTSLSLFFSPIFLECFLVIAAMYYSNIRH